MATGQSPWGETAVIISLKSDRPGPPPRLLPHVITELEEPCRVARTPSFPEGHSPGAQMTAPSLN